MIALGFCSFGGANNPLCFSYIPRQSEGEKLYTVTYFGMQKAVMSLLKANTEKVCEFTSCLKLHVSDCASRALCRDRLPVSHPPSQPNQQRARKRHIVAGSSLPPCRYTSINAQIDPSNPQDSCRPRRSCTSSGPRRGPG